MTKQTQTPKSKKGLVVAGIGVVVAVAAYYGVDIAGLKEPLLALTCGFVTC